MRPKTPMRITPNGGRVVPGILPAIAVLLTVSGCSDSESFVRAPVSGTVVARGRPLDAGIVRFVPSGETEGPVTLAKITDGCYSLDAASGPVVGRHRVEISATDFLGFDPGDQKAAERAIAAGTVPARSPVPPGYRRDSPLVAEISPEGDINLDFVLP